MPIFMRSLAPAVMAVATWHSGAAIAIEGGIDPVDFVQKKTLTTARQANPLGVKALGAKALAAERGGTEVLNDMTLKGVVADTRASNLNTGNNVIADGAFTGTVGLPMVIQNSGNGVLIQNATIINLQVK
jgi:hypothetical protein